MLNGRFSLVDGDGDVGFQDAVGVDRVPDGEQVSFRRCRCGIARGGGADHTKRSGRVSCRCPTFGSLRVECW